MSLIHKPTLAFSAISISNFQSSSNLNHQERFRPSPLLQIMGRKRKSENVPKNDAKVRKISELMCVSQSNSVKTLSQRPKCTPNRKFRDESNSVTDDIVVENSTLKMNRLPVTKGARMMFLGEIEAVIRNINYKIIIHKGAEVNEIVHRNKDIN
ncbi:hypothetical protein GQR58_026436 [Nymphon striatum]|nr:hypothetical protein GQR58_026436 [Nymphon striatum]